MRPLVSFVLLTFNQNGTIESALDSLLRQDYTPLEIVISDDHSTDGTWESIQRQLAAYNGPHRIKLNRNSDNLGVNGNYNKAFSLAAGELVLISAGDDISLPERASVTVNQWLQAHQKPRLIASPVIDMDVDGRQLGRIEISDLGQVHSLGDWLTRKPYVIGAGHAWHRSLFETFGPLPVALNHEDQIASYRAALLDAGLTLTTPLVMYRRGGSTRQMLPNSAQEWLEKRYLDAKRDAAFWRQMLTDSSSFPVEASTLAKVRRYLARCTYEAEMIAVKGIRHQFTVLLTHPGTDLGFRVRTFLSVQFASTIFAIKKRRRSVIPSTSGAT